MRKVLLAEDDDTMVSLLKTLLGMEGFQVATLMDQKGDPLETIRREKPDVVLLDIFLGDRNGLEILHRIRQSADLKTTRVLMTSGIDRKEECLSAGADGFLLKPFMPEDLIRKLHTGTG
jgi:DNA-binding response OmpR family regulator